MTNRVALALAILILVALAADVLVNDVAATFFLLRKFAEFVEYLAFWR